MALDDREIDDLLFTFVESSHSDESTTAQREVEEKLRSINEKLSRDRDIIQAQLEKKKRQELEDERANREREAQRRRVAEEWHRQGQERREQLEVNTRRLAPAEHPIRGGR